MVPYVHSVIHYGQSVTPYGHSMTSHEHSVTPYEKFVASYRHIVTKIFAKKTVHNACEKNNYSTEKCTLTTLQLAQVDRY